MKTIEELIKEKCNCYGAMATTVDREKLVEVIEEYAKQQAVEYGKFLGRWGVSWYATTDQEQWEWLDKAGERNYNSSEDLYDMWKSKDPKYRICQETR